PPQRNQCEAAVLAILGDNQLVIRQPERPEPGFFQIAQPRRKGGQHVHELNFRQLFEREAVTREEVANLVVGIVEEQRYRVELERRTQAVNQLLQKLRQRTGAQQLELALLSLLQDRVVATDFVGQLRQTRLKRQHLGAELCNTVGSSRVTLSSTAHAQIRRGAPPRFGGLPGSRVPCASVQRMLRDPAK